MKKIKCFGCGRDVAEYTGEIKGLLTWFSYCSECLFNVGCWTKEDLDELKKEDNHNE